MVYVRGQASAEAPHQGLQHGSGGNCGPSHPPKQHQNYPYSSDVAIRATFQHSFGVHSLHKLLTVPLIQTHRDHTAMSVWTLFLLALHLHRVPLKVSTYITEVPVWLQNRVLTTVTVMTLTAKSINLTKNSRK